MRSLVVCSLLAAVLVPCALLAEVPVDRRGLDDITADSIPTIRLSMQEWGVWQIDAQGRVRSLEDVARESPAFVHRQSGVPGPAPELPDVPEQTPQVFDKPVIFFFATRPLDVTVTVRVPNGRPWLYYPNATTGRVQGDASVRFQGRVLGQQDALPQGVSLPTPPNGHWWQWLRGVGASPFVTADGREAERFLFYDGQAPFSRGFRIRRGAVVPMSPNVDRFAWLIEGQSAKRLEISPATPTTPMRVAITQTTRNEVQAQLRARLIQRGLSGPIADSLLFTWRPELFGSPDRRVIWLLSEAAYDAMLPIEVVPAPEYRRRVGVVIEKL